MGTDSTALAVSTKVRDEDKSHRYKYLARHSTFGGFAAALELPSSPFSGH